MPAKPSLDVAGQIAERTRQLGHAQPRPWAGEVGDEVYV
jgi:hypothetical protein